MSAVVARLDDVWMSYSRWSRVASDVRGLLLRPALWGQLLGDGPPALSGVSLEVRAGRVLGLIGSNGAGKSTLLAVLAGIFPPRQGRVETRGRICPLLRSDSGFHADSTCRENAVLLGVLLGETRAAMRARLPGIELESELGGAFDAPLKTCSMGMRCRLSLAVASSLEPDLLLLDDHITYWDARAQARHRRRLETHKSRGAAIVMTTHFMETVAELCDDVAWLESGRVVAFGPSREVVERYQRFCAAV